MSNESSGTKTTSIIFGSKLYYHKVPQCQFIYFKFCFVCEQKGIYDIFLKLILGYKIFFESEFKISKKPDDQLLFAFIGLYNMYVSLFQIFNFKLC